MNNSTTYDNVEELPDGVYLKIGGDIDLARSPRLRQTVIDLASKKPSRMIIDLSDVGFMDSSGLATLVEAMQRQNQHGGKLILGGLQERVRSVFEIARLDTIFCIVDDPAASK